MPYNSELVIDFRQQPERVLWIDVARTVATVGVVLLHVSAQIMVHPGNAEPTSWQAAVFWNVLTRWCVPLFLMLSGWLLFSPTRISSKKNSFTDALRRSKKIALPLFVWSVVYVFAWHWPEANTNFFEHIWQLFVFDQPFEHLYFLFVLVELYLVAPVATRLFSLSPLKQAFFIFSAFLVTWFWPSSRFVGWMWIPYLSYFLLGGWFSQNVFRTVTKKVRSFWWWFIASCATSAIYAATWYLTLINHATRNLAWTEYFHPVVTLQTVAVFLGFSQMKLHHHQKKMALFAQLSLGIYLVHPLFVSSVSPWLTLHFKYALGLIPLITTLIVLFAAGFVFVCKKNPWLRSLC